MDPALSLLETLEACLIESTAGNEVTEKARKAGLHEFVRYTKIVEGGSEVKVKHVYICITALGQFPLRGDSLF